jgi:hypothetical protein
MSKEKPDGGVGVYRRHECDGNSDSFARPGINVSVERLDSRVNCTVPTSLAVIVSRCLPEFPIERMVIRDGNVKPGYLSFSRFSKRWILRCNGRSGSFDLSLFCVPSIIRRIQIGNGILIV